MADEPVNEPNEPLKKPTNKEKQRLRAERAAEALREKERRERRRQILTVAGVLAAIILAVGAGFLVNSTRDSTDKVAAAAPAAGSDLGLTIGPDSAPHKVVIYEDFLCPFCGELEKASHEELASLAGAGKVQVEYRPISILSRIDAYSEEAAEAFATVLEQSGPDVAKKFHDLLYANQPSEKGPFPSADDIGDLATQAGADDAAVSAFQDGDGAQWVQKANQAADDIKLQGTPTVLLDGKAFTSGRTMTDLAEALIEAVQ
jgi:protein-disulfide isomerase